MTSEVQPDSEQLVLMPSIGSTTRRGSSSVLAVVVGVSVAGALVGVEPTAVSGAVVSGAVVSGADVLADVVGADDSEVDVDGESHAAETATSATTSSRYGRCMAERYMRSADSTSTLWSRFVS